MLKTRISYTIKDNRGFLVEVERDFRDERVACRFIRTLNSLPGIKIVGLPVMETIGKIAS